MFVGVVGVGVDVVFDVLTSALIALLRLPSRFEGQNYLELEWPVPKTGVQSPLCT